MLCSLPTLFPLLLFLTKETESSRIQKPYVETYWESWRSWKEFPSDFGAFLKDVPASLPGSCTGANIVNIAFGDYSGGISGHESEDGIIRDGIAAIHAKGGIVKIALGGALFSMSSHVTSVAEASLFAEKMLAAANDLGLDGMDLDVEDGGAGADVQVAVIKETRRLLGPDFHITYTIPATVAILEPWMSTISQTLEELDAVNVMAYDYYWQGYTFDLDLAYLTGLGMPASKIVYGIMPGHADAAVEYTSLEDAVAVAEYVLEKGLAGVMTWDVNRDCRQRMNYSPGEDNLYQTGQGDGAFLDTLSAALNHC